MFAHSGGLPAATAALSLLFLAGCGGDESGSSAGERTPGASASGSARALDEVADRFVSLGTPASRAAPRWAPRVSVYIGGEEADVLGAAEASERSSWSLCPPSAAEYAMRKCPVSPFRTMDLLGREGGTLLYEDEVPDTVGCDIVTELPEWESLSTITIRPDLVHQNCFSDFAITLYVDDRLRVNAVSFTLSSP